MQIKLLTEAMSTYDSERKPLKAMWRSEDVFLLPKEVAQATKEGLLPPTLTTTKQAPPKTERREGSITAILPLPIVGKLTWEGAVPPQKWMTFYTKVLSRFPIGEGLKLTVKVEIQPKDGIPKQKVDETKTTLRELGLSEEIQIDEKPQKKYLKTVQ